MDELPVRGVDILRARHGSAALRDFYAQHAALFETNVLLVELIGAVETEHRFAGLCKPVYALGEGACIFIDAEDQRHLKSEPESVRRHLGNGVPRRNLSDRGATRAQRHRDCGNGRRKKSGSRTSSNR